MDFGAIQTDVAQGQHPSSWAYKRMCTEVFEFGQQGFAKVGNGVMIGMEATRKEVERHRLVGRPFNLAGTEGPCSVAIEHQTSKNLRRDGFAPAWTIVGVYHTQVSLCNYVDDEACQMVRRQTVA